MALILFLFEITAFSAVRTTPVCAAAILEGTTQHFALRGQQSAWRLSTTGLVQRLETSSNEPIGNPRQLGSETRNQRYPIVKTVLLETEWHLLSIDTLGLVRVWDLLSGRLLAEGSVDTDTAVHSVQETRTGNQVSVLLFTAQGEPLNSIQFSL